MSWIFTQIINAVADAVQMLLNTLIALFNKGIGLEGETTLYSFYTLFDFCKVAYEVFLWAGFFILFTICTFQLFKSFFGPLSEAESPVALIAKTVLFTGLVGFSDQIVQFAINIGTVPYKLLNNPLLINIELTSLVPNITDITSSAALTGIVKAGSVMELGPLILILGVAYFVLLIKEFFKLLLEVVERYVILGLLSVVAPLCIACGASKATNQVFKSFMKMLISQIIVMCFSVFFLKGFISGFTNFFANVGAATVLGSTGSNTFRGHIVVAGANIFVQALMLLAWLKLGQKIDAHMGQLGLNVAQAGGMADTFMSGMKDGLTNPNSTASKLSNTLSNKAFGTSFGQHGKTPGTQNAWDAALAGKNSKKSRIMEASNMNPGGPKTTPQKGAKAAAAKAAVNSGKYTADTNQMNAALRGQDTYGGKMWGQAMQEHLGLPEGLTPTENCTIGNGKMHFEGEKTNADGSKELVSFDASFNPTDKDANFGDLQGKGEWEGFNAQVTSVSGDKALDMLQGKDADIGPDLSADSQDMKAVNPNDNDGTDNKAWDPNSVQHFGEDGKPLEKPEKPDENDEKYMKNGEFDQEAYDKDMKEYEQAMEDYNNAPIVNDEGQIIGEDGQVLATMPDENSDLATVNGDDVGLNDLQHYDEQGNKIDEPKREDFANEEDYNKAMQDYNNSSVVNTDGNMYTKDGQQVNDLSNNNNEIGAKFNGEQALQEDTNGNLAATIDSDGKALAVDDKGDKAILDEGGTNGFAANNDGNGAFAYNEKTGQFVDADKAINSKTGALAEGVAGSYKDGSGNTVSASKALDKDGNLKSGFSAAPATFDKITQNSDIGKSLASQAQSGQGVSLQTGQNGHNNGHIERFDATGKSAKNGAFVKTSDGQLVSASTFKTNADGNVQGHTSSISGQIKAATGSDSYVQNNNGKGSFAYNQNTGQFIAANKAIDSKTGALAAGVAGSYKDGSGNTVSASKALDVDGNLKSGFSAVPATFDKGSGSITSSTPLQTGKDGSPARFNATGQADTKGNFVKTESGQLVSGAAATTSGATALEINKATGQVARFNSEGNADANGAYVKAQGSGTLMTASSFAQTTEGNVKSFSMSSGTSGQTVSIQSGQDGRPERFDASGNANANGDFYKVNNSNGQQQLVSASAFQTQSSGDTARYASPSYNNSEYGSYIKTENGNYARLAPQESGSTAPQTYRRVGENNYVPDAHGEYVQTQDAYGNTGATDAYMTKYEGASDTPGNVQTYQAAPIKATVSNIDNTPLSTSDGGYIQSGNTGTHCAGVDNDYHQIHSNGYSEGGQMKTFDRVQTDSGVSYVENESGQGKYAMTVSSENPAGYEYTELAPHSESRTYSMSQTTETGMSVSNVSNDGKTGVVSVDANSIKSYGNGMYSANISGQTYDLYDTAAYSTSNNMDTSNSAMININGKQLLAVPHESQTPTFAAQKAECSYTGSKAYNMAEQSGLGPNYTFPGSAGPAKALTAVRSSEGVAYYDSAEPRTYVAPQTKTDPVTGETKTIDGYYAQKAVFVTDKRPEGKPGKDFEIGRDPKTGKENYRVQTMVKYNSETGGAGALTFKTTLRDQQKSHSSANARPRQKAHFSKDKKVPIYKNAAMQMRNSKK